MFQNLSEFILWILVAIMEWRAKRVQTVDFVLIFAAGWFLSDSSALHQIAGAAATGAKTSSS